MASLVPAAFRRHRRIVMALAVLIAVRAALPVVVRRVLVSQASQALRARVEIGDVDLALLRGAIALDAFTDLCATASAMCSCGHPPSGRLVGLPPLDVWLRPEPAPPSHLVASRYDSGGFGITLLGASLTAAGRANR